jgi:hypothetical protein
VAAELHELLSITGEKPWKREIAAAIDQALHHGKPGISRVAKSGLSGEAVSDPSVSRGTETLRQRKADVVSRCA